MAATAITTAVTGGYDHPRVGEVRQDSCDYIFFCDEESEHLCPPGWEPAALVRANNPRLEAKPPKIHPHMFECLRDYEYVIWVDGGITIHNPNFADELLSFLENGMVLSPHFDGRKDAYGEATIRPPKYEKEPLDAQVEHYRRTGFPSEYGLYECGVIARNMKSARVEQLGNTWMYEVKTWSIQDQVSLPFVLWRLRYEPDVLPKSFREFGWVEVHAHRREE